MNTCKDCKHWGRAYALKSKSKDVATGGYCLNDKIRENDCGGRAPDELVYSYMEDGAFWTGPDFGCVHHSEGHALILGEQITEDGALK